MEFEDRASPKILISIEAKMGQMTPTMRKLARYLLNNFEKIDGMPMDQLSKKSGVSTATITRFVKEIGFNNYQAFLLEVAKQTIGYTNNIASYSMIDDDDISSLCNKVFNMNIQTIRDTLSILDSDSIEQAVDAIAKAKRVIIFAQGRSVVTATSIHQRLRRLRIFCQLESESHEATILASLVDKNDVVIGVSTYGRSRQVVNNMGIARERGGITIGVTSYQNVPIERQSDILLRTVNNENLSFGYEPSCSAVTQIILLDCLYLALYLKMGDKSDNYIKLSKEALDNQRI